MHDNLTLYGDNAYVNKSYMATPFLDVSCGGEDTYNFYHSQLQIHIECCFRQLVHHWSILHTAISSKMKIRCVIGLVHCLAHLHNFCSDVNRNQRQPLCNPFSKDMVYLMIRTGGYVPLVASDVPLPIDMTQKLMSHLSFIIGKGGMNILLLRLF